MMKRVLSIFSVMLLTLVLVGCTKRIQLKEKKYEAQTEVTKIEVKEISMPIEVVKDENIDNVMISYFSDEEYKLNITMSVSSKTLALKREQDTTMFAPTITFQSGCKTVIHLPNTYEGSLKIDSVNGSVSVDDMSLTELDIDLTNGSTELKTLTISESLKIDNTNGGVNINDSTLNKADIEITSGSLTINNTNINERIKTDLTNGSTKFNNVVANEYELKSTNGSTTLKNIECNVLLSVKAVTGSIDIELRGNESDYKTTLSSNVGSVKGQTSSGDKSVSCETNVGSIEVKYLG